MTIPALMKTKFLKIYWASNVGAYGLWRNMASGNKTRGENVPNIWRNSKAKTTRGQTPRRSPHMRQDKLQFFE